VRRYLIGAGRVKFGWERSSAAINAQVSRWEARLLFRLLRSAFFRESETLGFFAAGGAFLYVVSSLAISHEAITLAVSRLVPSDFVNDLPVIRLAFKAGDSHSSLSP
jgi:hypothetical protein